MNSLIPMLAVTGNPSKEQIYKKVKSYHDNGIGAFMIYPRSGLEVEYMSEAWLDTCGMMIAAAKEFSMDVWLYDEFNWPSGSCKNAVVRQNDAFYAKCLVYRDGRLFVDRVREEYCGRIFEPFENDMLNPEAVDQFIALTHEKYYERFGADFGVTIKGFFTDEPSFIYTASAEKVYPYYEGLFEDYEAQYGGKFSEDMETCEDFPGRFQRLIGERFRRCYVKREAQWCREHGILLTGHFLSDDAVLGSVEVTGNLPEYLEELDVPGIDDINTDLQPGLLYTQVEYMRRLGKKHGMAELFALGPCSMTYAERRRMIWYAAAHGVDHFFLAISHMDAKGNVRKPDFFSNFSECSPDFKSMAQLAESAEKAVKYAEKVPSAHVCIRYPYSECLKELSGENAGRCDALLEQLFASLRSLQVQYALVGEMDAVEEPVVFSVCDGVLIEEKSGLSLEKEAGGVEALSLRQVDGKAVLSLRQAGGKGALFLSWLTDILEQSGQWFRERPRVMGTDGELSENILVKQYEDGTILVIDTTPVTSAISADNVTPALNTQPGGNKTPSSAKHIAGKRNLVIKMGAITHQFILEKYGVYEYHRQNTLPESPDAIIPVDIRKLSATRCGENLLRCMFFEGDTFVFEVEEDVAVTLNRRCYPQSGAVYLDGEQVCADQSCCDLTDCFNHLYAASKPIFLKAGRHEIKTTLTEYLHLPAVVISGEFNREGKRIFADAEMLCPQTFFGQLKVNFRVDIPEDTEKAELWLEDVGMCVEAEFAAEKNELSFAAKQKKIICAYAPYHFAIPRELYGSRVETTLTFYSSLAPIFGDIAKEEEKREVRAAWVKTAPLSVPETVDLNTLGIEIRRWKTCLLQHN